MSQAKSPEKVVQEIRRKTRRQFSAEEKIRIVLEGLRGEESIAALCRREGLNPNLYYRWSKEFLEAGKKRLVGDTTREATSMEYSVASKLESKCRHKLYLMNDLGFQVLEGCPQSYPQTFWLPSDVPGFDGGFSTTVGLFLWRVLIRSENRDGVVDMYIPDRHLYPPFFVSMKVTHEGTRPYGRYQHCAA